MVRDEEFTFVKEVYDSEANEYVMTFECSDEVYDELVKYYGTTDFEKQFSKDFHNYVMSIKENSNE